MFQPYVNIKKNQSIFGLIHSGLFRRYKHLFYDAKETQALNIYQSSFVDMTILR